MENKGEKLLDSSPLGYDGALRIWSLWELMQEYKLNDFSVMLAGAIQGFNELSTGDSLKSSFSKGAHDISIRDVCTDEFLNNLAIVIEGLRFMCENFEADQSLIFQMKQLQDDLVRDPRERREGVWAARIKPVLDGIESALERRKFMFIPEKQAQYYSCPLMFGEVFLVSFPKAAIFEMSEAGKCYACGRWTACVFHCMRVTEYGLRRLFKMCGAKLPVKGVGTPKRQVRYQIEFGDWNVVIAQIKNKIVKVRLLPTGPRRERRLQFFSDAADHCEYMKDIWRNELSHTRRAYQEPEAMAVIGRVRGFMELITSGIPK